MEHEHDTVGTSGGEVSRVQNQLHVLPEDWSAGSDVVTPLLERIDSSVPDVQFLVITNDAEAAAGFAARVALVAPRDIRILAATNARRAVRVQRSMPAQIVFGAPSVLVEVVRAAALKLEGVRVVILAWIDDLDGRARGELETLIAELPKDSMRLVMANADTPAVEQIVERYARRARRVQPVGERMPVSLSYVTTNETARPATLRRVLDAVDPESAVVVPRGPAERASVEAVLRSLGYSGDSSAVRVADMPAESVKLALLYDLPTSEDELRRIVHAAGTAHVIALVPPRQIAALRRLAGGEIRPFVLPEAAERALTREERVRVELREVLSAGHYSRELLALEPLLIEFDGAEVAAAALRLLDTERAKPRAVAASAPGTMTRLYVNVGEMDNLRPADLVGAITSETGISKIELGRIEVRERHSTVEVATSVADAVVSKLTGVSIKGRRALVKLDEGRERRPGPPRERSARPARPGRDRPRRDNR